MLSEGYVGIFGTNESGTVGVGNAIAEAGGKVVGVASINPMLFYNTSRIATSSAQWLRTLTSWVMKA